MKTIILSIASLLLMLTNQVFSNAKNPSPGIDTLKKTNQYLLFNKTAKIDEVFISKNKKSSDAILYFKIGFAAKETNSNAIKTAVQGNYQNGEINQPTVSEVKILKGRYGEMKAETISKTASLYTLTDLEFPLHLEVKLMGETIEFELLEPGKWNIDLKLKNKS